MRIRSRCLPRRDSAFFGFRWMRRACSRTRWWELYRKHKIRMVFVNPTYQNPTGTTLPLERRQRLLELCRELRLPIVEDDAYSALTLDDTIKPPPALVAMEEGTRNVIYLGSLSKTVAPGLRIGWVIGPASVIARLADAKEQMDLGTSAIAQQLALNLIESGEWTANLKKLRQTLAMRRDRMIQALARYTDNHVTWEVPHGGYHIWCSTNVKVKDSDVLEMGIRHHVLFVPGGLYGAERGHVKFSFARATTEEIDEGIRRFVETTRRAEYPLTREFHGQRQTRASNSRFRSDPSLRWRP